MMIKANDYTIKMINGLECYVWGKARSEDTPVVFFIHGLCQSLHHVISYAANLANDGMLVIAIEHRNHGKRVIDNRLNYNGSVTYNIDSYGIYTGTVRDISGIIDFLPVVFGYEFTNIGVTGISLGGHASFHLMCHDERIQAAVPFIGSASRLIQLQIRSKVRNLTPEQEQKLVPDSLKKLIEKNDPAGYPERFANRPLLMVNGGADKVVPLDSNQVFYEKVKPYYTDKSLVKLSVYDGVEHVVTDEMWQEGKNWLLQHLCE